MFASPEQVVFNLNRFFEIDAPITVSLAKKVISPQGDEAFAGVTKTKAGYELAIDKVFWERSYASLAYFVVAHELAHVVLEHLEPYKVVTSADLATQEIEATVLACEALTECGFDDGLVGATVNSVGGFRIAPKRKSLVRTAASALSDLWGRLFQRTIGTCVDRAFISKKKLADLAYYDLLKNTNELKEEIDESYDTKRGFWFDATGAYAACFKDGEEIKQVPSGETSTLRKFAQGFNPITGEQLVDQRAGPKRMPGYDFTQSVPKPLSVLWMFSTPELRAELEKLVIESAKDGIRALNTYGGMTRAGEDGCELTKCVYAAALFLDKTARPVDFDGKDLPEMKRHLMENEMLCGREMGAVVDGQLHVHSIVPNVVWCPEVQQWRAVEGSVLFALQGVMAETFHASLAERLQKMGFVIKNDEVGVGFTIEGISDEICQRFSKRGNQISANKDATGYNEVDRDIGRKLLQYIKTNNRSKHSTASAEQIEQQWRERGKLYGFTDKECSALAQQAKERLAAGLKLEKPTIEEAKQVLDKLLENESVITDHKLRAACLGMFTASGTVAEINETVDALITEHCVELAKDKSARLLSSHEMIAMEQALCSAARDYKCARPFTPDQLNRAVERVKARKLVEEGKKVSAQQEAGMRYIGSTDDGILCIQGRAGSGKTFSLEVLRELALVIKEDSSARELKIVGGSLAWAAACNLQVGARLDSAAALADLAHRLDNKQLVLDSNTILVVDEAGIAGCKDLYKIIVQHAQKANSLVLLVGDTRQLAPVSAGPAFRMVIEEKALRAQSESVGEPSMVLSPESDEFKAMSRQEQIDYYLALANSAGSLELEEVFRQRQKWDKAAGLALSAGKAEFAIDQYMANGRADYKFVPNDKGDYGRIQISGSQETALDQMFEKYMADKFDGTGKTQLMIARTNEEVDYLNARVYQTLQKRGLIGKDVEISVRKKANDQAQQVAFAEGDVIQFRTKSGTLKITDLDEELPGQVYNRTRARILKIEGSGKNARLTVKLFDGDEESSKTLVISGADFKGGCLPIDRAWAMTLHSAQGQTYNRVYASGVHACDKFAAYVLATRHREDLWLYLSLDAAHAAASGAWSNTQWVNRNMFTHEMAIQSLKSMWGCAKAKLSTVDVMRREAARASLETVAARSPVDRSLAEMTLDVMQLELGRCRVNSPNLISGARIWNEARTEYVAADENLELALEYAKRLWGNKLGVSGDMDFQRQVARHVAKHDSEIEIQSKQIQEMVQAERTRMREKHVAGALHAGHKLQTKLGTTSTLPEQRASHKVPVLPNQPATVLTQPTKGLSR